MAKPKTCLYCAHGDNYWPMYVGNDWRKWGTVKCIRTGRRHDTADGCDKWEENQALEIEVVI